MIELFCRAYRPALFVAAGFYLFGRGFIRCIPVSHPQLSRVLFFESNPGAADFLALVTLAGVLFLLRLCSLSVFWWIAFLTALYRRRLQAWIEEAVFPIPRFLGGAKSSLVDGWKADGKLIAWMIPILVIIGAVLRMRFLFEPIGFDIMKPTLSYRLLPSLSIWASRCIRHLTIIFFIPC